MRTTRVAIVVIWLALHAGWARAAQKVEIAVYVPADTPAAVQTVYLAGSLSTAGSWRPDGVRLARQEDGSYAGSIELEAGQTLEFKITRGSWATVEKNADGSDRPNRSLVVEASTKRIEMTVERWAEGGGAATRQSTVVGTLKLHEINSEVLKRRRTIRVWLPEAYQTDADARFDVLYMQDGQNCFDRTTSAFGSEWEIDETLTKLIAQKAVRPLIVVGIDNGLGERVNEYTYAADAAHATAPAGVRQRGGRGADYARFVLAEVMPFIQKNYRVNTGSAHTFIGGSSLGGMISLEIARRHPRTFGGVIAMSPVLRWMDRSLAEEIERDSGGLAGARVWIDMGTRELGSTDGKQTTERNEQLVAEARLMDAALARRQVEHRLLIVEGAEHNEAAWAARFGQAVSYVLNAK